MKSTFALAILLSFGLCLARDTRQKADGPEWLDDLDAAFELAAEEGRPLLIVFR